MNRFKTICIAIIVVVGVSFVVSYGQNAPPDLLGLGVVAAGSVFGMRSLTSSKMNQKTLQIFPYEKVEEDKLPTFLNDAGEREKIPANWRQIGFEYPYPTVTRIAKIRKKLTDVSVVGNSGGVSISRHDPSELMTYLVSGVLLKILNKNTETGEIEEQEIKGNRDVQKWLTTQFEISSFLFTGAYSDYLAEGEDVRLAEGEEEEDFLFVQQDTSASKNAEQASSSQERPQPQPSAQNTLRSG